MSVIDEIRAEREDLARVLKKHAGIRKIVEDLYPDSAHFIYELLQNAEDAGAKKATFALSSTALVFTHDGRPFNRKDIEAITDIGEGTKAGDTDKIGQFGVGFKAVFAYTETPRIWCKEFAFEIKDLVLPYALPSDPLLKNQTRFEFPFNSGKKAVTAAYDETATGLRHLAETTLLFLTTLESILWTNQEGEKGEILRIGHSKHHVEIIREINGVATDSPHFLKFDAPIPDLGRQRVGLAFDLSLLRDVKAFTAGKPLRDQFRIVPADPGKVAIFFPAEKETSGLRFHLHAPFVPELSRASVKDTPANRPLFEKLAGLTAECLHEIKALGLLNAEFLAVLPNPKDSLPLRYDCIRQAVIAEMNEAPLTPTYDKTHAPAKSAADGPAALKRLLTSSDLDLLLGRSGIPLRWVVSPAQRNSDAGRFLSGLAITRVTVGSLIEGVLRRPAAEQVAWLSEKEIPWHQHLYAYLWSALPKDYTRVRLLDLLKQATLVRRKDGTYARGEDSFFAGSLEAGDDGFPPAEPGLYTSGEDRDEQDDAKKMLKELGVREVTEQDRVKAILDQRYTKNALSPKLADLARFVALVEKEPSRAKDFEHYFIFKRQDGKWGQPAQVFLDAPFLNIGLAEYYRALADQRGPMALATDYENCDVSHARIADFAKATGAICKLPIHETKCRANPDSSRLLSASGFWTSTGINRDYAMPGLDKAIAAPAEAISRLIWATMCTLPHYPDYLQACYRNNKSNDTRTAPSQLVHQLRSLSWVPQSDGLFVRPRDATREKLPAGFPFDAGWPWIKAIQFGEGAKQTAEALGEKAKAATSLGFESADEAGLWLRLKESGIDPRTLLEQIERKGKAPQPEDVVRDPVRRRRKVLESQLDAPTNESVLRERQIQAGISEVTARAKAYLRSKYSVDGQLVCQSCDEEMPFKLPSSGEYYFEAVQCLPDDKVRHFQNRLALCPTCAAMYQHARETNDEDVRDRILNAETEDQAPAVEVSVRLAGSDQTVRFVGTHWFDLKTVLDTSDE
jgi:hypothetical protein